MKNSRPEKKKKPKSKARLFVSTLLTTLGVFLGVFAIAAAGFTILAGDMYNDVAHDEHSRMIGSTVPRHMGPLQAVFNMPRREPESRSFALIMGVDDTRTDTMMLAGFDPETREVTVISLPRDSHVIMPQEQADLIRAKGGWVPSNRAMKLNEVHHYAFLVDPALAPLVLKAQVEDMLGIEIDYYIRVSLDAFEFLVDEIGGVYFDVPVRMFYRDPCQDLVIDIQPGFQRLNGHDALGFVRYRNFPAADFVRMRNQQEFLRAFVAQAMDVETIMSNIPAFLTAAFRYVDTDFTISDIPRYVRHIHAFDADNISIHTLPHSHLQMINGISYVILDEAGVREMVDDLLLGLVEVVPQTSEDLRIQVLNGAGVSGLARSAQELMELNGLSVLAIGDYTGMRTDNTRIFVRTRGMGGDIADIINNSTIIHDPGLDSRYDIVVVIGRLGLD